MNKKLLWIGVLLLLVLSGVALYIVSTQLGVEDLSVLFGKADLRWLLAPILCMLLYVFADALNICQSLSLSGYRISLLQMIRYAFAGFFFSSITPSSTGGQPGQLYFMKRDGIHVAHGAFALLCALLSYQVITVVWGITGAIFSHSNYVLFESGFTFVFLAGFLINLLIIVFLLCILFSGRVARFMAWVAIGFSEKILKRHEHKAKILRSIGSYRKISYLMKQNKNVFFRMLLVSAIQISLYHSIPYFCCNALGNTSLGWFDFVCTQGLLFVSVSSLPLPGAAGVTEYGYALFYSGLIPDELLGSALVMSRFFNFVLPLIVSGLGLLVCSFISLRRRANHTGETL